MVSVPRRASVPAKSFPVDGQLLRVLPQAGAAYASPDVQLPTLRTDGDSYYLEMQIQPDAESESDSPLIRRIPLDNISTEDWDQIKSEYDSLDLASHLNEGISRGLGHHLDQRVERMLVAILTFLNPRQVSILLHLYRLAAQQDQGSHVSFRSDDLLTALGYNRIIGSDSFPSKLRIQLHRDLLALHRTELIFAQPCQDGDTMGAKVLVKNVLRIRDYAIENIPPTFDLLRAADYTDELADAYTISLEFFDGPTGIGDYVLFANTLDIRQHLGHSAKHDYKTRLLVYLASRIKQDHAEGNEPLTISKPCLFKNLGLLGKNASRNNQILWRTVNALYRDGYLFDAQEIPGERKITSLIQFRVNSYALRACS